MTTTRWMLACCVSACSFLPLLFADRAGAQRDEARDADRAPGLRQAEADEIDPTRPTPEPEADPEFPATEPRPDAGEPPVTPPELVPPESQAPTEQEGSGETGDGTAMSGDAQCRPGSAAPVDASPDSPARPDPFPLGGYVSAGIAISNPAAQVGLALRYRLSPRFLIGAGGEFNPWFSRVRVELRAGSTNIYATGIHRIPLDFERINLRSSLHLGVSRMNFDLFGVPKGSIGPFVGFNLLGLDIELGRAVYLVIDPADIALPIPQLDGVPFVYPQYRFTVGLQIGG